MADCELFEVQGVTHANLFGLQIAQIVLVWSNLDGYILDNLESVGLKSHTLHRVVCKQSHLVHTQVAQHLCSASVVALIGLESQMHVGVYGVKSFLLKFVGRNLVHQSDATAFLLHVYYHALAFFLDGLHGLVQLFAAIAALTAKYVARHA